MLGALCTRFRAAGRPKVQDKNRSSTLVPQELINNSKTISNRGIVSMTKNIFSYDPRHLPRIALAVEGNIWSWVEKDVSELEHSCPEYTIDRLCWSCHIPWHTIVIWQYASVVLSILSQILGRVFFVTSLTRTGSVVKSVSQHPFRLEQWYSLLPIKTAV